MPSIFVVHAGRSSNIPAITPIPEQQRAEQTKVAQSADHSDQPVLHCHSQEASREATKQATAT